MSDDDRDEATTAGPAPDDREAYIERWGGYWGESVSSGGVWIPATRTARGHGGSAPTHDQPL